MKNDFLKIFKGNKIVLSGEILDSMFFGKQMEINIKKQTKRKNEGIIANCDLNNCLKGFRFFLRINKPYRIFKKTAFK